MKVAALQFEPRLGEQRRNVDRLLGLLDEAFRGGAEVAVAPEMATSGYCFFDRREVLPLTETVPGPTTAAVARICARFGSVAVFGLPEVVAESGICFNSVAVVGPAGVLGRYRKLHSFISEPRWAMDGNLGPLVVRTPYGSIGVLDCADVMYAELARSLQILGADLIAFPTDWCSDPAPSAVWWARAWELGLPLIAADRIGLERGVQFAGGSAIFDGDGRLLAARDQGEGVVLAEIGPRRREPHTAPMARDAVVDLARSTHMFNPEAFFSLYGRKDLPESGTLDVEVLPLRGRWTEISARLLRSAGRLLVLPGDAFWAEGPWDEALQSAVAEFCRQRQVFLACGVLDADGARALVLVGPEGVLIRHRPAEGTPAAPISTLLPAARVALCSGEELAWPEVSRLAAANGADLLLALDRSELPPPGAFPGSALRFGDAPAAPDPWHYFIPRVRAITDDICVAYASADMPCGFFEAESGAAAMSSEGARGTVDTRPREGAVSTTRSKPLFQRRRPEHYWALWSSRARPALDGVARDDGTRRCTEEE